MAGRNLLLCRAHRPSQCIRLFEGAGLRWAGPGWAPRPHKPAAAAAATTAAATAAAAAALDAFTADQPPRSITQWVTHSMRENSGASRALYSTRVAFYYKFHVFFPRFYFNTGERDKTKTTTGKPGPADPVKSATSKRRQNDIDFVYFNIDLVSLT